MGKYYKDINLSETNSAHTRIVNLAGRNKKVVEFGCAGGHMSKVLKEENGCEIVGLEIDEEDARQAERYCRSVIVGDIENLEWCEKLSGSRFDVAIFADVIEHLKAPERVLARVKDILKDDACILISVPNIANIAIRLELLLGSFEYEKLGILDNTHLKYFTLKTITGLIESAGLYIDSIDYQVRDLPAEIIRERLKLLDLHPTEKTMDYLCGTESLAFIYILKVLLKKPEGYSSPEFEEIAEPDRIMEEVFQGQASQIQAMDGYIESLKKGLEEKEACIKDLENRVNEQDAEFMMLKAGISELECANNILKQNINAILDSRSWKIMRPLQKISELLGKLRKG